MSYRDSSIASTIPKPPFLPPSSPRMPGVFPFSHLHSREGEAISVISPILPISKSRWSYVSECKSPILFSASTRLTGNSLLGGFGHLIETDHPPNILHDFPAARNSSEPKKIAPKRDCQWVKAPSVNCIPLLASTGFVIRRDKS